MSMREGEEENNNSPLVLEVSPEQADALPLVIDMDLSAHKVQK